MIFPKAPFLFKDFGIQKSIPQHQPNCCEIQNNKLVLKRYEVQSDMVIPYKKGYSNFKPSTEITVVLNEMLAFKFAIVPELMQLYSGVMTKTVEDLKKENLCISGIYNYPMLYEQLNLTTKLKSNLDKLNFNKVKKFAREVYKGLEALDYEERKKYIRRRRRDFALKYNLPSNSLDLLKDYNESKRKLARIQQKYNKFLLEYSLMENFSIYGLDPKLVRMQCWDQQENGALNQHFIHYNLALDYRGRMYPTQHFFFYTSRFVRGILGVISRPLTFNGLKTTLDIYYSYCGNLNLI